ncbi:MAG: DUF2339 domain-containing protein [Verrucomicrobiota bacterium]|jgi:hypothetical protein|nr:DUF2339 domain-containing protein [Verrucomicrobiota bacterium]
MELLFIGLVGLVLVLPIVALLKAFGVAMEVNDLRKKVQRLQDRLNDSEPLGQAETPTETKQAALAKPEPEHFTLSSGLKESRESRHKRLEKAPGEERQVEKQKETSAPKPESVLPPVIQSPKPASPAEPAAKPEKDADTSQAGMPRLPKLDAESIEMKLGTYWFVRIGVMLVLTGLGILAYYKRSFFIDLSPEARVSLFYLLSAAMGGVGFWLQRTKEKLKNYGQVLLAGGFAGVYFTTYAAHVIPPVRIIDNATFALLLMFAWGGFMVWIADRLKSETIALFATGASYYATYVPLIHADNTGGVSWVILFSNLVLAVAAVVFMLRNRWLKMPVLSLSASYAGFLLWRLRVDEPSLTIAVSFAVSLWVVYTAAVFLSRSGAFSDRQRAAFLTANNAAMFGLLTADVLKYHEPEFWILPMVVGLALLGCAVAAARWLEAQSLSRKSYLTQGLVLVTLGLMTKEMADSVRGPILAAESVVLLFMAIRRDNFIIQIGALIVSAIAVIYALIDIGERSSDYLVGGLSVMVFLLFNSRLCHERIESALESILRPRVSYLTGLGLFIGLAAFLTEPVKDALSEEWFPTILLATTVLFAGSVYRWKLREFTLLGQVPGLIGLLYALGLAESAGGFSWPLFSAFVLTLGQAHWWRWQRARFAECCPDGPLAKRLPMIIEAVLSGGFVLSLLVWLHEGVDLYHAWLWAGAMISVGMTVYAVFTRARFVGLFSQFYLLMSCWVMFELCVRSDNEYAVFALIPIVTMYLMNIAVPIAIARIGHVPEIIHSWVGWIQLAYRIAAAALGLLWIGNYVPNEWQVLVFVSVGVVFFAMQFLRPAREWQWLALAYAVVGYLVLAGQFINDNASWPSLVAIVSLFGVQQLAWRCKFDNKLPDWIHQWLILVGGALFFIWLSIKVSEMGGHGARTIAWSLLAVVYFGAGLGLRERWYRLMGLGTLAIALLSLVPIIWGMSTEWKIASFFVMGGVFLGLGFVYTRYRDQLKKLL